MIKIGLDAGHGLKTQGKQTPNGIKEWTLNDKVRDKIVAILKDYNVQFVFTDNDEGSIDESLASRINKYMNAGVDVFVSIHHNAYNNKWNNVTGVEVWTDKNPTQADIKLANCIYKNLPRYTKLKGRGIKRENWWVINQNKIPAVLVEGGFMDSNIDYPIITSEEGQNGYARAVAEGLIEFLNLKKSAGDNLSPAETITHQAFTNYTVKVNTADLNVREGAGINYKITAVVHKNEIYTIVAEKNGWGRLKSGIGWINLSYTVKVNVTHYYSACANSYTSIVDALHSINIDSSFQNRKKIAIENGIYNYIGTSMQNNQLLAKLKAGKLKKV